MEIHAFYSATPRELKKARKNKYTLFPWLFHDDGVFYGEMRAIFFRISTYICGVWYTHSSTIEYVIFSVSYIFLFLKHYYLPKWVFPSSSSPFWSSNSVDVSGVCCVQFDIKKNNKPFKTLKDNRKSLSSAKKGLKGEQPLFPLTIEPHQWTLFGKLHINKQRRLGTIIGHSKWR